MLFGKHINKYYLRYLHMMLIGIFALALVDLIQLKVPELYRMVINGINEKQVEFNGQMVAFDLDFLLNHICLPMIIIAISMVIGRFTWRVCFYGSGIKVEADLRKRMFDRSKNLSQQYYQVNKVGTLMALYTNDIDTVQDCFSSGILMFFDALSLGVLSIIKMGKMDWLLTLFALIPMMIMLAIGSVMGRYMMKKWDTRQQAFSTLSDFSQESFSGIAVIKAFVKEFKELYAFKKLNKDNEDANVEYTKASTLLHVLVNMFIQTVVCIILGYGSYLVYKGTFNAGQLVEFTGYFSTIIWPVMAIAQLIEMKSRGTASLKRIGKLLDTEVDVKDRENVEEIENLNGTIEFKNLTFRYPDGDYDVLKDLSFKINAGENVGIVGKTGAGKTTIVDLILRNYNIPDGTIFIDGYDVNSISIHSVRENTAYVPQDNFLFSDTIYNNIAFASNNSDEQSVENSAKLASVSDNIEEFPEKYQTVLGERGVTVSGGQKQRISIARALMKNAHILILDDSLSAVDTKTERELLTNLKKERCGKTTILIAHRISTIAEMDKIIFIDEGKLIAIGSHQQLIESCPEYKKMVELQKLEEEEDM